MRVVSALMFARSGSSLLRNACLDKAKTPCEDTPWTSQDVEGLKERRGGRRMPPTAPRTKRICSKRALDPSEVNPPSVTSAANVRYHMSVRRPNPVTVVSL